MCSSGSFPGQRTTVKDLREGRPVDPIHGQRAKQRSVHNTYFTLPVLFAMLSNHYSFTYGHPYNWVVLILMMFAGAAIRQFFVMRHGYKLGRNSHPWPYALVGVAVIAARRRLDEAGAVAAPLRAGDGRCAGCGVLCRCAEGGGAAVLDVPRGRRCR